MMQYRFDKIAFNSTAKKKPTEEDKEHYIGLEHLDSDCLSVTRWGSDVAPKGEKLLMKKGDVLFGKRRAYQRKVGIAPFDGIFSAHGMVLRPNEEVIDKNFFPFFISSDQFMERAVRISVGGLSPTINWKDLREQEFEIPSLSEQKKLSAQLWAAYRLKESYKKLLTATDEMVKSQFIEMFGSHDTTPVGNYIEESYPGEWGSEDKEGTGVKVIRTTNFTNTGKLDLKDVVTRSISDKKIERKTIHKYDTILERSGGTSDNPVGRVVLFEEDDIYLCNNFTQVLRFKNIDPRFAFYSLFYFYQTNKTEIRAMGSKSTGIQNLNMSKYLGIGIPNASEDEQSRFVSIADQADKSQFIEMFGNPLSSQQKYPLKKLGECCEINPKRPLLNIGDDDMVSFVPMQSVSEEGFLCENIEKPYSKVKKGFTYFKDGDVLFAKITPCMENGKGAIAENLTNGIGMGSTEFHVLRPIPGKSTSQWILALTRMPNFRAKAARFMSGTGGQKRVGTPYLENFKIGLPPIDRQKQFAEIYVQADKSEFDSLRSECELELLIKAINSVIKSLI